MSSRIAIELNERFRWVIIGYVDGRTVQKWRGAIRSQLSVTIGLTDDTHGIGTKTRKPRMPMG